MTRDQIEVLRIIQGAVDGKPGWLKWELELENERDRRKIASKQ